MYTVYQHIFPNGKRYVGLTRNQVEKRWGCRGSNYRGQPVVWNAIQKYGWENIEHDIFALCETKEQAERVERWLIKYHDTTNPLRGYNVLPGGDVSVNDATPEMRYKLGNGNRGKKHTEEQKQKISESVKRKFSRPESNGCFGKRASEETKEKMRIAKESVAKQVNCYSSDGKLLSTFRTINEAAKCIGCGTTAISRCCRHLPKYKTVKGYRFEYVAV